MHRSLAVIVVLGAALPSAAQAPGPPFENLSPRNGAYVTVSYSGVKVEFSCPANHAAGAA